MILLAFLLLFCAVFTWKVFPKRQETERPHESRGPAQAYDTLDQVKQALQVVGLESSNLIIAVDFTKSNEWTGKRCFQGRSLHHLDLSASSLNPYEQAIGIIGNTLSSYDEDNKIPCFGFGDMSTHDQDVFRFYGDGRACVGVPEVLQRDTERLLQACGYLFVDFTKIMSTDVSQTEKEEQFTFEALKKIPTQYTEIISQQISDLATRAPSRTPLPPPLS